MFIRLGHILLIAALLAAADTHWILLQSVAWTSMLAGNLQTGSIKKAVELTFDGNHVCTLCMEIAAGKKAQKKAEFPGWLKKLEFSQTPTPIHFLRVVRPSPLPLNQNLFASLTHAPPVPPPRGSIT